MLINAKLNGKNRRKIIYSFVSFQKSRYNFNDKSRKIYFNRIIKFLNIYKSNITNLCININY